MKDFLDRHLEMEEQVRRLRTDEGGSAPTYDHTFIISEDYDSGLYIPPMVVWGGRTIQETLILFGSGSAPSVEWEITQVATSFSYTKTNAPFSIPVTSAVRPVITSGAGRALSIGVKISG